MLESIKKSLDRYTVESMEEYGEEFETARIIQNINRCKTMGKILLTLYIGMILMDLFFYRNNISINRAYLTLYYSHIVVSVLVFLWLVMLKFKDEKSKVYKSKTTYYLFICIVFNWCVFERLNSVYVKGQISIYIICFLGLSISLFLKPTEIFTMTVIGVSTFLGGLFCAGESVISSYNHIINPILIIIFTCSVLLINYYSFLKDFVYKRNMLISKKELEITNLKLKEYEKLRTDFFANISHELRTPINVIYSAEQIINLKLKTDKEDSENIYKYLKMIKQNSFRLIRLINNLIDITKIDATNFDIKPTNCDIVRIVESIISSIADYVENRGMTLIFDTEVEEKLIACDPDKIERIMLNLISNAIKFTEKDGIIFVRLYLEKNNVYISVKDNGIGISEEMKDLIFDRFIQVDKSISRNREGSGIGLSLVKSLVELHKGTIAVRSELGKGSEFIVSLPDCLIEEEVKENDFVNLNDHRIEKINIEFSDIYD